MVTDPDLRVCLLAVHEGLAARHLLESLLATLGLAEPALLRAELERVGDARLSEWAALADRSLDQAGEEALDRLLEEMKARLSDASSPTALELTASSATTTVAPRAPDSETWTVTAESPGATCFPTTTRPWPRSGGAASAGC